MKDSEITLTFAALERLIEEIPTQVMVKDRSTWKTIGQECTNVIALADLKDAIDKLKKSIKEVKESRIKEPEEENRKLRDGLRYIRSMAKKDENIEEEAETACFLIFRKTDELLEGK